MIKIIDGKKYDTKKAEELHSWSNIGSVNSISDFGYYEETLHMTKNGAFFLSGVGGASSPYSEPVSGGRGAGEDIRPITEAEAMTWLERHDGEEILLSRFADHIKEA